VLTNVIAKKSGGVTVDARVENRQKAKFHSHKNWATKKPERHPKTDITLKISRGVNKKRIEQMFTIDREVFLNCTLKKGCTQGDWLT
jgi:hypothetical protein